MPAVLPAMLASSFLVLAADRIPQFDPQPSCQAASQAAASLKRDTENCLRDERKARSALEQEWAGFTPQQRSQCARLSTAGGRPSYVELLTCLETAKQAAKIPDKLPPIGGAAK